MTNCEGECKSRIAISGMPLEPQLECIKMYQQRNESWNSIEIWWLEIHAMFVPHATLKNLEAAKPFVKQNLW